MAAAASVEVVEDQGESERPRRRYEGPCCEGMERRFAGRSALGAREDCDAPKRLVCRACGAGSDVRCGSSRSSRCSPCSESYRRRVLTVASSGRADDGSADLFVTLTAPGEQEHYLPNGAVCPCTPSGGVNLAVWNAEAGKRWSRFIQELRREVGDVEYFKGVEVQKRGALHFHALFRVPPGRSQRGWTLLVRRLAIKHGFGHSVDATPIDEEHVAGYVAKYASKATDDRHDIPWCDRETGEMRVGHGRYRVWSSSRSWGLSMQSVRAAQRAWVQAAGSTDGGADGAERRGAGAGAAGALDTKAPCSTHRDVPP